MVWRIDQFDGTTKILVAEHLLKMVASFLFFYSSENFFKNLIKKIIWKQFKSPHVCITSRHATSRNDMLSHAMVRALKWFHSHFALFSVVWRLSWFVASFSRETIFLPKHLTLRNKRRCGSMILNLEKGDILVTTNYRIG